MLGVKGGIQREDDAVHIMAQEITDLSADLASIRSQQVGIPLDQRRRDEVNRGSAAPDSHGPTMAKNLVDLYGRIDEIRVRTRSFR